MNGKPRREPKVLWSWLSSALLMLASLTCFGFFFWNSMNPVTMSSSADRSIALFGEGAAEYKHTGMMGFKEAARGMALFSGDLIWVGPGRSAMIRFLDESELVISENTLLVLRRRHGAASEVNVLTGDAEIKKSGRFAGDAKIRKKQAREADAPPKAEVPEAGPVDGPSFRPQAEKEPDEVFKSEPYPAPDTLFALLERGDAVLAFAWPDKLEGSLVIMSATGSKIAEAPLKRVRYVKIKLGTGKYSWQVRDAKGQTVIPATIFEVRRFDAKQIQDAMKEGLTRPIEIMQ